MGIYNRINDGKISNHIIVGRNSWPISGLQ